MTSVSEPRRRVPGEKTRRPRDELGRLLRWDEENRLHLEDFDALPLEENHRLGAAHFDAGRFFPAHEAWETAWKQARDTGDAEFFKGLSQLGAGYVHLLRGNRHGTMQLLRRAAKRIVRYPEGHFGVDTAAVSRRAEADAEAVERGDIEAGENADFTAPRI
jgi:predicted metal-dependent hydrolase